MGEVDLDAAIRRELDAETNKSPVAEVYADALRALLDVHREFKLFEPCGHGHAEGEPGVFDIEDVGLVCEEGYEYSVCQQCCCDGSPYQSEACADVHDHSTGGYCPHVVGVVARELGVTQ